MVRFRFGIRSPGRLRPWAVGMVVASACPPLAASSAVESLETAVMRELSDLRSTPEIRRTSHVEARPVRNAGAPRQLPGIGDASIRPVSGQAENPPAAGPTPAQPTPAQLEVVRQLEEMYERDGRGQMPSLRLRDAPNTRLPNGLRAVPANEVESLEAESTSSMPGTATVQPTAGSASMSVPPAPAPSSSEGSATRSVAGSRTPPPRHQAPRAENRAERPNRGLFSWFRRDEKPQTSRRAEPKKEGVFSRMFRPFRRDDEPQRAEPTTPPVPPQRDYRQPSTNTAVPRAPQPMPSAPAQSTRQANPFPPQAPVADTPAVRSSTEPPVPQSVPRSVKSPVPSLEHEEFDANTFGPDTFDPDTSGPDTFGQNPPMPNRTAASPVTHPLSDTFSPVRGWRAPLPDDIDPEFTNAESATPPEATAEATPPTGVSEAIAADDPFGSIRPEGVSEDESGEPAPMLGPQPSAAQSTAEARYAELQRKLAERAGLGGFQGFCPVALHDGRELLDSRPQFVSFYAGRAYELSSADAKVRFDAQPEVYAPVNQGNDVVLTARGETEVEGNLNYAVWYKDRLYMFRSAETLREFDADPARYAVAP